jgi:polar amino acid transport system permease protein
MTLDPAVVLDNWPLFVAGAFVTLQVSAIAFVGGLAIAAGLVALWFAAPGARLVIHLYLGVLRGVPFLVLLFLVHFGMPFAGVRMSAYFNGTLALTLYASAYYAEVLRASVQALPRGQWESARAIGMSPAAATRYVIAPQIVRPALPPTVNCTITVIKESSVMSAITVGELTYQGLVVQGNTFAPFEVFIAVAGLYWLMAFCLSRASARVERAVAAGQGAGARRNAIADRYLSLDARRVK